MPAARKKRLLIAGISVVGALVAFLIFKRSVEGPFYSGRTLARWIEKYYATGDEHAEAAIQAIGTNGIPYLLKWIDYREKPASRLQRKFDLFVDAIGRRIGIEMTHEDRAEVRTDEAMLALKLLGPLVTNSLPQLTMIFETHDDSANFYAGTLLESLGDVGVKVLIAELNHERPHVRSIAAFSLREMGEAARPALPFLLKALNDQEVSVAGEAALALGELNTNAELCVAALSQMFQQSAKNFERRNAAIMSLGNFGTNAVSAVPLLLDALETSNDESLRSSITNCVLKIAPDIYADKSFGK